MTRATEHATKHITNSIEIWSAYRDEIADNGMSADHNQTLYIAPEVEGRNEYLYIETNGDPVLVGWIEDGEVIRAEDAADHIAAEDWLAEALDGFVYGATN